MELICSSDGDIPLWMKIASGNETDKQQFGRIREEYKRPMKWNSLIVLDSGFYSQSNLQIDE
jgi:transposase